MKKRLFIWILITATLFIGWKITPNLVRSSIPSIYYVTPTAQLYENVVNCSGTIQAVNQSRIVMDSPSMIKQVYADIGDYLQKGDVIADIEPVSAGSGIIGNLPQTLQIDLEAIESLMSAYGLTSILEQAGLLAPVGLEDIFTDTPSSGGETVVPVASNMTQIIAPESGIITSISLAQNIISASGEAVVSIMDNSAYKVLASVGEGDISKIKEGDKARIRGVAFGGKSYSGTVTKIYPTARKSLSGTSSETVVDVEILLDSADSDIKPGFSAKVEITGGNRRQMITVPYEAIRQDENNNEFVYTYENGRLKKSVIVTGAEMINEIEILEGINADSIVVFNPDDVTGEGAMIHIKGKIDAD